VGESNLSLAKVSEPSQGCVYNRGCNHGRIFANEGNYLFLLRRVKSFLEYLSLAKVRKPSQGSPGLA